jgi:hypothetical protein
LVAAVNAVGVIAAASRAAAATAASKSVEAAADDDGAEDGADDDGDDNDGDDDDGDDDGSDMATVVAMMVMLRQHTDHRHAKASAAQSIRAAQSTQAAGDAAGNAAGDAAGDADAQLEQAETFMTKMGRWRGSRASKKQTQTSRGGQNRSSGSNGTNGSNGSNGSSGSSAGANQWTMSEAVSDHSSDNYVAMVCNHHLHEIALQITGAQQQKKKKKKKQDSSIHRGADGVDGVDGVESSLHSLYHSLYGQIERLSLHKPKRSGTGAVVQDHYFESAAPPSFKHCTTEAHLLTIARAVQGAPPKSHPLTSPPLHNLMASLAHHESGRRGALAAGERAVAKAVVDRVAEAAEEAEMAVASTNPLDRGYGSLPLVLRPVAVPELSERIHSADPQCDVRIIGV